MAGVLIDVVGGRATLALIGSGMVAACGLFLMSRQLRRADAEAR